MKKNQPAIHSIKKPVDLAEARREGGAQSPRSKAASSAASPEMAGSPPEGFNQSGAGAETRVASEDVPSFTGLGSHFDEEVEIAILAQRYYREEGCPGDRALDHWLRAEGEVRGAQHCQGRDPEAMTEAAMMLGR